MITRPVVFVLSCWHTHTHAHAYRAANRPTHAGDHTSEASQTPIKADQSVREIDQTPARTSINATCHVYIATPSLSCRKNAWRLSVTLAPPQSIHATPVKLPSHMSIPFPHNVPLPSRESSHLQPGDVDDLVHPGRKQTPDEKTCWTTSSIDRNGETVLRAPQATD